MKIFITGAKGQLGKEIIRQIEDRYPTYGVVATDIDNLDITCSDQVFDAILSAKPNVVINCAAYTNVDRCETNEYKSLSINGIGVQNLSAASFKVGAKLVQVSTDYVFDGTANHPYRETDSLNPINVYGASKKLGEDMARTLNPRHFIVRTAWLYGDGANFVKTMIRLGREKGKVKVVDDQVGSPTSTLLLARCILDLIHTDSYGVYHGTCQGSCSWYEFAKEIFKLADMDVEVTPTTTEEFGSPARRPAYSVLDNFMLKLIGLDSFVHWREGLEEYFEGGFIQQ